MEAQRDTFTALYASAQRAFPTIEVPFADFELALQRALGEARSPAQLPTDDLYLACACLRRDAAALSIFEQRYAELLQRVAARAQRAGVGADEFLQQLRIRLFVGNPSAPALTQYRGTGPLGGWLRVVATRCASELIEQGQRTRPQSLQHSWSTVAIASDDVELATMRNEVRGSFQVALHRAAQSLPSAERALLRQYYVHQVGVDGIAKLLGVHRSNASRAVARARSALLREVKRLVGEELGLRESSLDSAFGLMRGDLLLSLGGVLQSER